MTYQELKNRIGNSAKDIIISDLRLSTEGNRVECPIGGHKKDKCMGGQWYDHGQKVDFSFHCHDCKGNYDIINHSEKEIDRYEYLCKLAGVDFKRKIIPKIKHITENRSESGEQYLINRGISKETISEYGVTSDNERIYFNYFTPEKTLAKIKARKIGEFANSQEKYTGTPSGGTNILYGMNLLKRQQVLIICEGEIDALSMHEILKIAGKETKALACSMPSGSSSFGWIEECGWWLDRFDSIIIVPDSDQSGEKMLEVAKEKLDKYDKSWIDLSKFEGITDVNQFITSPDYEPKQIFKAVEVIIPELEGIVNSKNVRHAGIKNGIPSGYITHDHNDNGLKEGCLTVLTGATNDGKTTYSRQILVSLAIQKVNSFMFVGETSVQKEKYKLARLCAQPGEIHRHNGLADSVRYYPDDKAIKRYDETYGKHIFVTDINLLGNKENTFDKIKKQMKTMAKYHDVRVFILDNLMVLCEKSDKYLLAEQKRITLELKSFAEATKTHVILIAHPRGGEGFQKISGAQEIQNACDTILRYIRLKDEDKDALLKKYPEKKEVIQRSSARIRTEKIREDGHKKIALLEWDETKGAVYDMSDLMSARGYEAQGFWTRAIHRYDDKDVPECPQFKDN